MPARSRHCRWRVLLWYPLDVSVGEGRGHEEGIAFEIQEPEDLPRTSARTPRGIGGSHEHAGQVPGVASRPRFPVGAERSTRMPTLATEPRSSGPQLERLHRYLERLASTAFY